ncbi:Formiminotetrahydrofolate cyclodeaminase [Acetitomaculum ruminis DSM 5522]|uniref:Formiminotetrahydrofolate cyclodeaminase n=1 Tax=Acetitomaculum ruminis DSM 5522 TaxID=1120918 RepID=A0A1I0UYY4_9FIRM|nr:cyclodeaminase/cyclohydrolase family protein [Acetitomaculum ruminis]SFA69265.1 Formiminotetrahydrofolate cyclodeaminase [Acetitomaculum ruminis DSM 5522]
MEYINLSAKEFVEKTFSKEPVPGGGGVAAIVGALGAALGGMVCNLTTGKKKYAQYQADIERITEQAQKLQDDLLSYVDQDAQNFLPLSKAYGLPKDTEEEKKHKDEVLQAALKEAIKVPIYIVKTCYETIKLEEELAEKGSMLAISDVACGMLCLKAAIRSGWMNVVVNLNTISDKEYVENVTKELLPLLKEGEEICDRTYKVVAEKLNAPKED